VLLFAELYIKDKKMIKFSEWEQNNFRNSSNEPGIIVLFPSREIYFSNELLRVMRFENSTCPKNLDQWYELCQASDHMKISKLEKFIYNSRENFFSITRALYCGDGVYRNFRLDAFIQRDNDGQPVKLYGNEILGLNAWLSEAEDGDRLELEGSKILEASRVAGAMTLKDVTIIEDLERENLILRHEISRRIFAPFPEPLKNLTDSEREDFIFDVLNENLDAAVNILPGNSQLRVLKNSLTSLSLNIAVMGLSGSGKTTLVNILEKTFFNGQVNLIDTAGWDALNVSETWKNILPEFDFIIYVLPVRSRLKGSDYKLLNELKIQNGKIIFVLSKIDLEIPDTEAGQVIKTPEEKILGDIDELKNEIKNFNGLDVEIIPISAKIACENFFNINSEEWKNSNIDSVINIIKNFSENLREKTLTLRAERALKIIENSRTVSGNSEIIIKNLQEINQNELEIKIPDTKFNFNFPHEPQEKHLLSSLITSMREHGFKGRFFSLGAFNGRRKAILLGADRTMSMKLFARLSHNLRLENIPDGVKENEWLGAGNSMPFDCKKLESQALAKDENILIAPPDYLLEDFRKKIFNDYTPVVSVDLARLESGLSDLIYSPYASVLAKSKWILAFPNAALLSGELSMEELKSGIKNFCGTNGLKSPDIFIYENYTIF